MRLFSLVLVASMVLTGCGAASSMVGSQAGGLLIASGKQKKTVSSKLDQASYEAGLALGLSKSGQKASLPRLRQGSIDRFSFNLGQLLGLLQGALNSYNRLEGEFNVKQFRNFAEINRAAIVDARDLIRSNKELLEHKELAGVLGLLEGGLRSFDAISGSFNVTQWKSFADSNREVLQAAVERTTNVVKGL
jgi:hypothetical protein